ncbi:MAG: OmpA family protein [Desulfobulbales bacterium]|nr:OmpA family protein [Desulfobulbales bacterium]
MIGSRKLEICFCLALTALFSLSGCAPVKDGSYVVRDDGYTKHKEEFVSYKIHSESYKVDPGSGQGVRETRYVAREGSLVRITPERPEESAAVEQEVLAPIDAEFKAARTPELLAAFIEKYAPTTLAFVALQRLAKPFIDGRDWPAAIAILEKYRDKFPYFKARIDEIVAILEASEEGLVVANLGGEINTPQGEYNPVIASDGKTIYFARDCGECSGGEEVHVSRRSTDGRWGGVGRFGEPLASKGHETPLGISADNNTLLVYGHYDGSLGRGDIFYVEKNHEGWGDLQHYPAPLNSEHFESNAVYTADGKAILFISDRPDGVGEYNAKGSFHNGSYAGNTDIYVFTEGEGGAGEVINLGPTINTAAGEYSPYLHPDGRTLYFSSNGHSGLGGLDVFKATRLRTDSWTEWSEPVNLGKEINTSNNDWGYQVAAEGSRAYFAGSGLADSYGGSDIYSITLPEKVRPGGVITISGVVTDPQSDPLVAEIRWDDLDKQEEVGYATSDPITGEYVIHLPSGGNYGYYAEKPGYMGESQHFDLRKYSDSYREYVLDIVLHPIVQPVPMEPETIEEAPVVEIRMNNIFFDFDKAALRSESYMEMNRWIRMLQENGHINLHISGHADSIGTEDYNRKLSEKRARAVADYLVENGIARDRLTAEGFGESMPVANNETEAGRQRNRRVQVRIINSAR